MRSYEQSAIKKYEGILERLKEKHKLESSFSK